MHLLCNTRVLRVSQRLVCEWIYIVNSLCITGANDTLNDMRTCAQHTSVYICVVLISVSQLKESHV